MITKFLLSRRNNFQISFFVSLIFYLIFSTIMYGIVGGPAAIFMLGNDDARMLIRVILSVIMDFWVASYLMLLITDKIVAENKKWLYFGIVPLDIIAVFGCFIIDTLFINPFGGEWRGTVSNLAFIANIFVAFYVFLLMRKKYEGLCGEEA